MAPAEYEALAAFVPVIAAAGEYMLAMFQGKYDADRHGYMRLHVIAVKQLHASIDAVSK